MRIGMRTVKTAVSAALAMWLAALLQLPFWPTAGIIAVLSVQNTTKASFQVIAKRLGAIVIAFALAWGSFSLLGFTPWAFGLFLIIFIPVINALRLQAGLLVSAVLVVNFMLAQSVSLQTLGQQFALLIIGAGVALLANLFMPNLEEKISLYQDRVTTAMTGVLRALAAQVDALKPATADAAATPAVTSSEAWSQLAELKLAIQGGLRWTTQHRDNQVLAENDYFRAYFEMRQNQFELLHHMQTALDEAGMAETLRPVVVQALTLAADATKADEDPHPALMQMMKRLRRDYEALPLPTDRAGFLQQSDQYDFIVDLQQLLVYRRNFAKIVATQN